MQLQVLGVGDAFTSRYYNTSFLLRSRRLFLIDGPHALFRLLRERRIERESINDVIVTHVHGDHTSGLETLILWKKHVEKRRLVVHTSKAVFRELRDRFFVAFQHGFTPDFKEIVSSKFEDYVQFSELKTSGRNPLDDDVSIEVRHNWHPTPTLGLMIVGPGGSVGISGDTCYRPSLLRELFEKGELEPERYDKLAGDWLWSADVIYHEAARQAPTPHTLESDLLELPEAVRSKIRLIHYSDNFTQGPLPLAQEGEIISKIDYAR
ncbi:MAG: MBL fold metallo-hydrolase [Acidobacteriota bacterium]